jgi:hypothetical protein
MLCKCAVLRNDQRVSCVQCNAPHTARLTRYVFMEALTQLVEG